MTRYVVVPALVLSWGVFSTAFAATEIVFPAAPAQLLPGDRVLLGTVEEIAGEQAGIDTGEVQPRYIPMNVRKAKELPKLKRGIASRSQSTTKIYWSTFIRWENPAIIASCMASSSNRSRQGIRRR